MQYFKGDETEIKFYESGKTALEDASLQKDLLFEAAYSVYALGDLIYDNARAPLANAIPRAIFRESFSVIFDAFIVGGSFESYLTVFRHIFGDDVEVIFTVPAPGKLNIEINAAGVQLSDLLARKIVAGAYVFEELVDYEDNNIVAQTVKGFQSEYDLNQMLYELVPAGIFTDITLSVG